MKSFAILGRPTCCSCQVRYLLSTRRRDFSSTAGAGTNCIVDRKADYTRRIRLPDTPARTRFAPSPTGYLHLGSLRTALYNYLLARATNGQFLLRLEDTDQSRIVPDAEERLYKDLKWSGLSWDEGPDCGGLYGPYKQSQRLRIYQEHADRLVREGKAFRCFCSHDDMTAHHQRSLESDGTFGRYPGLCLSIPAEESADRAARGQAHTIRFKSGFAPTSVHDIVYGQYKKKIPEDHFIVMKSDGFPTYHFANVVDDHLMKITHVIRGAEWLISTAKHVSLYDAFGWEPPKFAHVGLLVDMNRQKLSKRNMDIGIASYMREGTPAAALLNFAALLGWNPGNAQNKGVMTLDDMVKNFGLKFTKGDIVVNLEKLRFFHKKHIRLALDSSSEDDTSVAENIARPILQKVREIEAQRQALPEDAGQQGTRIQNPLLSLGRPVMSLGEASNQEACSRICALLRISRSDAVAITDIIEANKYLIWQPSAQQIHESYSQLSADAGVVFIGEAPQSVAKVMDFLVERLCQVDNDGWTYDNIQSAINETVKQVTYQQAEQQPVPVGYKFLRWALLGLANGPQITPLMEYLGREETVARLQIARSVANSAGYLQKVGHVVAGTQEQSANSFCGFG